MRAPMLLFALVGPELFTVVLGNHWTMAGVYAGILSPWLFLAFASFPIDRLFFVLERQGYDLFTNVTRIALRIAAIIVGGVIIRNITWTIVLFAVVNVLMSLWRTAFLFRQVRLSVLSVVAAFALDLLRAIPTIGVIVLAKWYLHLPPVWIVVTAAAATIPYLFLILRAHEDIQVAIGKLTKKVFKRK